MPKPDPAAEPESDVIWGMVAIARYIKRTPPQGYYLFGIGALDGAVRKLGRKTIIGSRRKLDQLFAGELVESPPSKSAAKRGRRKAAEQDEAGAR